MNIVNVADIVNPDDPEGRTYRQINAAMTHTFPVGSLVEYTDGTRLWVVYHARDCDQTPLYCLGADKDDTVMHDPMRYNHNWHTGYPEESLRLIIRGVPG